jgi:hypothetical protein
MVRGSVFTLSHTPPGTGFRLRFLFWTRQIFLRRLGAHESDGAFEWRDATGQDV